MRLLIILALAGMLSSGQAPSTAPTTLYVDAALGNDSVSRAANSAERPWKTIGRAAWGSTNRSATNAAEAAQAGDRVMVAAGTYDFSGRIGQRWGVVYNPVNEGTSPTNAITFVANGPVILTAADAAAPVIGCYGRDHIVWSGPFDIDEANISISPDTGTVVMSGDVTGCGVDGIRIDGNGAPKYVDNHTGVRIEVCRGCFVRNSTITAVRHMRGNHNGSGVMLYDAYDTLIENNYIHDVDNAVYIKGAQRKVPQSGTTVRYNLMANCGECLTILASKDSRIYQNVIRDSQIALNLTAMTAEPINHPVGDWIVNNTIDNMSAACIFPSGGPWHTEVRIWNNILTNCRRVIYREEGTFGKSGVDWQHNVYDGFGGFANDGSQSYGIEQWRSNFAQDHATPASKTTNPGYVNRADHDFRLCRGARTPRDTCRTASAAGSIGVDILDLNRNGQSTDLIPAGAFVTNEERIGPVPKSRSDRR
jgi:hypothetical protein